MVVEHLTLELLPNHFIVVLSSLAVAVLMAAQRVLVVTLVVKLVDLVQVLTVMAVVLERKLLVVL